MRVKYWNTFFAIHRKPPIKKVTYGESNADIFSKSRGFVEDFDFTMQIQVGCPGGCQFCYVANSGGFLTPPEVSGPWALGGAASSETSDESPRSSSQPCGREELPIAESTFRESRIHTRQIRGLPSAYGKHSARRHANRDLVVW